MTIKELNSIEESNSEIKEVQKTFNLTDLDNKWNEVHEDKDVSLMNIFSKRKIGKEDYLLKIDNNKSINDFLLMLSMSYVEYVTNGDIKHSKLSKEELFNYATLLKQNDFNNLIEKAREYDSSMFSEFKKFTDFDLKASKWLEEEAYLPGEVYPFGGGMFYRKYYGHDYCYKLHTDKFLNDEFDVTLDFYLFGNSEIILVETDNKSGNTLNVSYIHKYVNVPDYYSIIKDIMSKVIFLHGKYILGM